MDRNVRSLSKVAPTWLVDHDRAVRQAKPLAFGSAAEQQRAHRCGLPNANCRDGRSDIGHGIVDGEPGGHGTAWGIDVEGYGFVWGIGLEVEELGDDGSGK